MKGALAAAFLWILAIAAMAVFSGAASTAAAPRGPHYNPRISAAQAETPTTTPIDEATPTVGEATPVVGDTTPAVEATGIITEPEALATDTAVEEPATPEPAISPTVDPAAAATLSVEAVLTGVPGAISTGGVPNPPASAPAGGVVDPGNDQPAGGATDPGTPDPEAGTTVAAQADTNWLPIVGGLLILGLAAAGIWAYRRRTTGPGRVIETPLDPNTARSTVAARTAPAAAGEIRCPNCETLNPAGRRFCDECGQDLRAAAAAAAAIVANPVAPSGAVVDESEMPYLETLSRPTEQLEYVLTREVVNIGRAPDNDIVIDETFIGWPTVSQHHARLRRENGGFVLEDLNSENGTFINGARTGQNLLEDGMTISAGKVDFIYRQP